MIESEIELAGLRVIAVGDRETARAVVVLLHGFQMEPRELSPFAHSLGLPVWFLCPEGPVIAAPRGRAWWHIDTELRVASMAQGPRDFAAIVPPDLDDAHARLTALLDEVLAAAAGRPVVVAGFSQGGMLTCDTLVRAPRPVAGVALLSASRLNAAAWPPFLAAGTVRGLPVLISHGTEDDDLAFSAGTALRDCLIDAGAEVRWVPFDQGHGIPLPVWRHLRKFIDQVALRPA